MARRDPIGSLLVIGAGPGGYETAVLAARAGLEVTLVTSGPLGGTCLNEGCIPTKCLCHSAEEAQMLQRLGLALPDGFWEKALARKEETVQTLRKGIDTLLRDVRVIRGTASFAGESSVRVRFSAPDAPASAQPYEPVSTQPYGRTNAQPDAPASAQPYEPVSTQPYGRTNAQPDAPASAQPYEPVSTQPYGRTNAQPDAPASAQPYEPVSTQPYGRTNAQPEAPASAQPYGSPDGGGETLLTADRIIVATGSESVPLDVPGAELPEVLDSGALLGLTTLPRRLAVIGGGVIGLEFASVFAALGAEVTVLEYCGELLPRFDKDLSKRLKQALSRRGITVLTGAQVTSMEPVEPRSADGSSVRVHYIHKDKACSAEADKVLMAVGRKPRFESLNLSLAGIEAGKRGIAVDGNMRTTNPRVYAIGDVTGGMMLAHAAASQGKIALKNILEEICPARSQEMPAEEDAAAYTEITALKKLPRPELTPAAVFTIPELAAVGLTEEECRAKGIEFEAVKSFYRANGKALSMEAADGYCKLLIGGGRILGCHIMGAHASDLIAEVTALMNMDAGPEDLASIIHAHPTLSEILAASL